MKDLKFNFIELSDTRVSNDCVTIWNYLNENPNCTLTELKNNFDSEHWMNERKWNVTFCSNLVYVLKRLKQVKCIEIIQNRNTGGEFDYATINLIAEPIIRKNLLVCVQCNEEFKKKGSRSKYKTLCIKCTKSKFMSPKIAQCGYCKLEGKAKSMRSFSGILFHQECFDKHMEDRRKRMSEIFTKKRYCRRCKKTEVGKYVRFCKTCHKKPSAKSITCEICLIKISKKDRGTNKTCNNLRCMATSVIRENAFFSNRRHSSDKDIKKRILGESCVICGYNKLVHYHHVIFRENGGEDCMNNITPLCPNHHAEVHHCGLDVTEYHNMVLKRMQDIMNGIIDLN
jgi:aerobic-type carbon monoxide dehydrogenase small subunit (CoxS/CutS family)